MGLEPTRGLEPPTPCLQDLVQVARPAGLTCENATATLVVWLRRAIRVRYECSHLAARDHPLDMAGHPGRRVDPASRRTPVLPGVGLVGGGLTPARLARPTSPNLMHSHACDDRMRHTATRSNRSGPFVADPVRDAGPTETLGLPCVVAGRALSASVVRCEPVFPAYPITAGVVISVAISSEGAAMSSGDGERYSGDRTADRADPEHVVSHHDTERHKRRRGSYPAGSSARSPCTSITW